MTTRSKPKLKRLRLLAAAGLMAAAIAAPDFAHAGSVENMERERAILLETLMSPDLTPEERQSKVGLATKRLVDLERIVLRDKSLTGRNTPAIKRAFANYDLTFLIHAAIEKERTVLDHWLEQVGVSENDVMSAKRGRR